MESALTVPLVEKWAKEFRAAPQGQGPAWMDTLRQKAAAEFEVAGIPNRKTEDWKYTPLRLLEQRAPGVTETATVDIRESPFTDPVCHAGAGTVDICDGRLNVPLPECADGLTVLPLAEGVARFGSPLQALLESTELEGKGNTFSALNTAFLDHGLVIHVGENVKAGSLLIRWSQSGSDPARIANFRLIVLLDRNAELDLVEQFESAAATAGALNIVTQATLAERARLGHVRVQNEADAFVLLTSTTVEQAAASGYHYSGFDLGGGLVRHGLKAILGGTGAATGFDGAFVLDRKRHVDNHVSVDHAAGGCSSSQFFRGVLGGSSRGVFNGRALIRPGADGSSVRQSNANLLLSALAEMDTKPELEIYADEVEASHGATVGQLDETAVFYLRSRGIEEHRARRILTTAFCHAVTDRLQDRNLAERISTLIDRAMPDAPEQALTGSA